MEELRVTNFEQLSEEAQDFLLCEVLHDYYEDGDITVQTARDLIAALQKTYLHRRKYTAASWVVRAWASQLPISQAAPLPENTAYAFFTLIVGMGRPAAALALLLSFCGLLRISEALNLARDDVVITRGEDNVECVILLLRRTKRGIPLGERVVLSNPAVIGIVKSYIKLYGGCGKLFLDSSYSSVRRYLAKAALALGFESTTFRTHSCRRGGASALALRGVAIQDIMFFGRWSSESSCREYIKKGETLLVRMEAKLARHQILRMASLSRLSRVALIACKPCGHEVGVDSSV